MAAEKQGATRIVAAVAGTGTDWKSVLMMMVNPAGVLKRRLAAVSPVWALFVSGLAFTLFFLQTGLDLHRSGESAGTVAVLAGVGLLYGTVAVAAIAIFAWLLSQLFGGDKSADWSVKAFALGYSPALIYTSLGLVANLAFGLNTAVVFGVTGMLWALGPIVAAVKEMTGQRTTPSIIIATLCGGLLLFGWWLLTVTIGP